MTRPIASPGAGSPHVRKWTAFYLSLAVPGAGQLWLGSAWCGGWWLAACLTALAVQRVAVALDSPSWAAALQVAAFLALGACSAEHAKRLASGARWGAPTSRATARVTMGPRRGRQIASRIDLELPAPAAEVWTRVADLPRFLTIDAFHDRVTLMRSKPAAGVDLVLGHNAFGHRFLRFGRLLYWREGRGYAFSDLSPRGRQVGFPHVFFVEVETSPDNAPAGARLSITVRGKWTNRWIPVAVGRRWVEYVTRDHARLLLAAM